MVNIQEFSSGNRHPKKKILNLYIFFLLEKLLKTLLELFVRTFSIESEIFWWKMIELMLNVKQQKRKKSISSETFQAKNWFKNKSTKKSTNN